MCVFGVKVAFLVKSEEMCTWIKKWHFKCKLLQNIFSPHVYYYDWLKLKRQENVLKIDTLIYFLLVINFIRQDYYATYITLRMGFW